MPLQKYIDRTLLFCGMQFGDHCSELFICYDKLHEPISLIQYCLVFVCDVCLQVSTLPFWSVPTCMCWRQKSSLIVSTCRLWFTVCTQSQDISAGGVLQLYVWYDVLKPMTFCTEDHYHVPEHPGLYVIALILECFCAYICSDISSQFMSVAVLWCAGARC